MTNFKFNGNIKFDNKRDKQEFGDDVYEDMDCLNRTDCIINIIFYRAIFLQNKRYGEMHSVFIRGLFWT